MGAVNQVEDTNGIQEATGQQEDLELASLFYDWNLLDRREAAFEWR